MSDTDTNGVSRRNLLTGLGAGAGILGLAGVAPAKAALLPEPETQETYDVVVIGSGLAGCAAALEAASTGARVIVLEKAAASRIGGSSLLAGGTLVVPGEDTTASRAAFIEDFETLCRGRGNSEIFTLMAENATSDIAWLESFGIAIRPIQPRLPTRVWNRFFDNMPALFRTMRERIVEHGGVFAFDTKAKQLVMDERGAVVGVRTVEADGVVDYRASAVVIAAGGYGRNTAMLEAYTDPNGGALGYSGVEWATGDGLTLAQAAGAGLAGMGGIMGVHVAAVDRIETVAAIPAWTVPYAVSINREGRRFVDESFGYVTHGKAVLDQPQQTTTLVFDHTISQVDRVVANLATYSRLGLTVYQADTLDELARQVDLPVEPFLETIAGFNAAIDDNGVASAAVPPKATLASPILTPPFYAFHGLVPSMLLTFGGIMINGRAQVLEPDRRVIPGLFAAGECAGAVFHHDYIGGGALTNCLVMGRIAGREAVTA